MRNEWLKSVKGALVETMTKKKKKKTAVRRSIKRPFITEVFGDS